MKTITHETTACMSIDDAAKEIIEVSKREKACVESDFNGVILRATPSDNPTAVVERWDAESVRRQKIRSEIETLEKMIVVLKGKL